jgi:hypothetical protein
LSARTPTGTDRRTSALALRWVLLAVAAIVGWLAFTLSSDIGVRSGWSYLAGLALVVGSVEFGAYNVRFTARYLPQLTLIAALLSYTMTVVALGLVFALSSPRVVDGMAIGIGIFVGVGVWIGTEIERTRVRSART